MSINGPVRVLVVDDHAGIRSAISRLIDGEKPSMISVGVAATPVEALNEVKRLQPDVVVLDVNLAGEDGLVLIPLMRRSCPCEVIVLTSLLDPRIATDAERLGARGCVHKTAPASVLLDSIAGARAHAVGESVIADPTLNGGGVLSRLAGEETPLAAGRSSDGGATGIS
jgi:DNA-binding NarL/FixJ family response regulator